jgi:hypothetical protein
VDQKFKASPGKVSATLQKENINQKSSGHSSGNVSLAWHV